MDASAASPGAAIPESASRNSSKNSVESIGLRRQWSPELGDQLQEAVDRIFGKTGQSLLGLEFSFSIADPLLNDCPLIGCSTGFTKLCGYEMHEIIGRNCRFMLNSVPDEKIDHKMRAHSKAWCNAVLLGQKPPTDHRPWIPQDRPADELICMQVNRRKNGTLFNNLFYLKVLDLGLNLGETKPYIIGLQSELKDGQETLEQLAEHLQQLNHQMETVKAELTPLFFVECGMSRQIVCS